MWCFLDLDFITPPLVPHICVSESGQHRAYSAPDLYLYQCWVIVNWDRLQFVSFFNHPPPLVPHICGSESGQYWCGWWLIAYSAPDHCPGQCWVIVNWNGFQWNFYQNTDPFIGKMHLKISSVRWWLICPGGDELNHTQMTILNLKTHWGRVMHICVSNLTSNGPGNGLSPGRR